MDRSRAPHALAAALGGAAVLATAAATPALAAPPTSQTATPTIRSGPANGSFVASTSATFSFNDKNKATFTCSLDGATAAACTSPKSYTNLTQGKHTFTVVATASGKTASAPATRSWTVDTVAPKAAIAAPTGLTSPVVIPFGEPVRAVHATIATLSLTDGGAAVPVAQTCWSGSSSVACSTGLFDTVRLKPQSALTSGQHYTVTVPATSVRDRANNANAAAAKAFRGARVLQENAPGIAVGWQTVKTASAAGGSYVREHLRGSTASYSFTGTSITWSTVTGPTQGEADVYIDGVRKKTVNNYATATHYKVARTIGALSNKAHRLRIVVLGVKSKAAKGTFVSIDAFTVGTSTNASPALATTWRGISSSHLSGGHAAVADLGGQAATFSFRGTGITLYTVRGVTQGQVALYIDGVRKATWDDYATSTSYGVKRAVSKLTDTVHSLRLVVLGKHHKGAKGNVVTIDRFAVA